MEVFNEKSQQGIYLNYQWSKPQMIWAYPSTLNYLNTNKTWTWDSDSSEDTTAEQPPGRHKWKWMLTIDILTICRFSFAVPWKDEGGSHFFLIVHFSHPFCQGE